MIRIGRTGHKTWISVTLTFPVIKCTGDLDHLPAVLPMELVAWNTERVKEFSKS